MIEIVKERKNEINDRLGSRVGGSFGGGAGRGGAGVMIIISKCKI